MKDKESLNKLLKQLENFLKNNKEFQKLNIHILFLNSKNKNNGIAYAFDKNFDYGIRINLKDFSYRQISSYDFDFDNDIFKLLEKENDIAFISYEENFNIWTNLDVIGLKDFKYRNGMKKYFEYCKQKGITKKYFDEMEKIDMPDMLQHYYNITKCHKRENNQER